MFVRVKGKDGIKKLLNTKYITQFTVEGASIFAYTDDNLNYELENTLISLVEQLKLGGELFDVPKQDKQEVPEKLKQFT